jgi:hypothetical protein
MHRLILSLAALVIAVVVGCTTMAPSPTALPDPTAATNTPAPSPIATAGQLPSVTPEEFFLSVSRPDNESVVDQSPLEVQGSTVVDAVVTVNGHVVEVGPQGEFAALVDLEEGPNVIEVIASDFAGHEESRAFSIIYIP